MSEIRPPACPAMATPITHDLDNFSSLICEDCLTQIWSQFNLISRRSLQKHNLCKLLKMAGVLFDLGHGTERVFVPSGQFYTPRINFHTCRWN